MPSEQVTISVDSDMETRKGVHSDAVNVAIKDGIARVDFFLVDMPVKDGAARGVLTSRVFMSRGDLSAMRQAIDDALAARPGEREDEA